jgi:hypothetical protein
MIRVEVYCQKFPLPHNYKAMRAKKEVSFRNILDCAERKLFSSCSNIL